MMKYCVRKWDENKAHLESCLRKKDVESLEYEQLVTMVVDEVLNRGEEDTWEHWNTKRITRIDDGDYQGTLLFVIPKNTYQPSESEYLMTFVDYGSCSGCDTLECIQGHIMWDEDDKPYVPERVYKELMMLCKDLLTNMICPYNRGWRAYDEFEEATT